MSPLCLDDATLDDYVHARLSGDAQIAAETHVDSCADCSAIVSVLAGGSVARHDLDSPTEMLAKGTAVGRHVIVELRGEGAMGVVYLAYDPELDRKVALKLLRAGSATGASERMQREAQAMARIAHPNVVTVHDVGRFRGSLYLAMEFVEGPTLRAWCAADHSVAARVSALGAAGRGLSAAHDAGLVHRDFKPENVLVGNDGRVRVTDFGLARVDASEVAALDDVASLTHLDATLTRTGALLGTPAYMAPELWRGEDATAASDQFAFAVTLYEALVKTRPFRGKNGAELRAAIDRGPSDAMLDAVPDAARMRKILTRALSARAEDRYPSLAALLDALEPAAPTHPAKRSRAVLATLISLVLTVGVALTVLIANTHKKSSDPCGAGAPLAAKVIAADRLARIRTAFSTNGAAGASWSGVAADRAIATLVAYCTDWSAAHRTTCEATEVRHEQSPALLDARMHCLNRGLDEASALADRFEHADADTILHATEAAGSLPTIASCADSTSLAAMEAPPTGEKGAALGKLEPRLAAAEAASAGGATSDAQIAEARVIVLLSSEISYRPTIAEARLLLAKLLRRSGAFADARREADAALVAAEGSRDDREAALVWLELLALHGEEGNFAAVIASGAPANAALSRIGLPADLEASLLFELGVARTNQGDYEGAARDLDASKSAREKLWGEKNLDVARTLTALGNLARVRSDLAGALTLHQRALAIDEEILGPDHPALARHHHNIGGVLRLQGKLDEATAEYEHAEDLDTRALGPRSLAVGLTENSLGLVAIAKSDWPGARAHLDRALDILGSHPDRALTLHNLGIVDAAENKPRDAIARFDEALAIYRAEGRDDATVADVKASRAASERALKGAPRTAPRPAPPPAPSASAPSASASATPSAPPTSAPRPTPGSYGAAQTFDTEGQH